MLQQLISFSLSNRFLVIVATLLVAGALVKSDCQRALEDVLAGRFELQEHAGGFVDEGEAQRLRGFAQIGPGEDHVLLVLVGGDVHQPRVGGLG